MGRPQKSVVYAANATALGDMAQPLRQAVDKMLESADRVHTTIYDFEWEGEAKDAADGRADREIVQNRAVGTAQHALADAYENGKNTMQPMIDSLKSKGQGLEADDFSVSEDWVVTDTYDYDTARKLAPLFGMSTSEVDALQTRRANEATTETTNLQRLADELGVADENTTKAINDAKAAVADAAPELGRAPSAPRAPVLPDDPEQFTQAWNNLSPQEKDAAYQNDHLIGNHPGMPCDPPDHLGYDHYNRRHLADELAQAQAAAAQADALKNQHPDWAQGKNVPPPNEPGAFFADRQTYESWQRQYDAARNGAKYLPDLQAVDKAVKASPDRKLMLLDTETGKQARAAIAVGNPDTATHVSVTTPGLNTTVHGAIGGMTDEATHLRTEALGQLRATGHAHDTVSAIAWIGYDTPQIPGWDHLGTSMSGGWDVMHDDLARAGAHDLARFYDGIQASHQGSPADLTAIGHSYGSLTTGLALQEPGDHGVSRALFYGSPGIEASTPQQLHLQPGHVYAMETSDDPIQWVYDARSIGQGIPIVGTYLNNEFGDFGPNPATNPNFTHLATGPTTVPGGRNLEGVSGSHAHSQYPQQGDNGQPRTSGYNIAAVIAGTTPIEDK